MLVPCLTQCNPCAGYPKCMHGRCFNISCRAVCICDPGYAGTFCETSETKPTSMFSFM